MSADQESRQGRVKFRRLPWGWSLSIGPAHVVVFRSPHEGAVVGWGDWRSRAVFLR